jgi:parallel beta-helix repeat protein
MHIAQHLQRMSSLISGMILVGSIVSSVSSEAATYYVATTGNDANQGTESQPFRTIQRGVSNLRSGDTLYIRQGTYADRISPSTMTIPSGTSWSNPVTISGYSGETVTLQSVELNTGSNISYVVFDNLVLDAKDRGNGLYVGCGSHHIRLSNSEVKNALSVGVEFCNNADDNEVIDCSVHDSVSHGLYITSSNNLFDGNSVYNNGGYGYHFYNQGSHTVNNNIIRNSEIYKNGSGRQDAFGIILGSGDNNVMYDNIVRDNPGGIQVAYGNPRGTDVTNNTVDGNSYAGIWIFPGSQNTIVENNSVNGNPYGIINQGTDTVLSNNGD